MRKIRKKRDNRAEGLEYPIGTLAVYGPDDRTGTKMVAGVILGHNEDPAYLKRWYALGRDIRDDETVAVEVLEFFDKHNVEAVSMADRIIGCPHEEGIDYPAGGPCPMCPFWANRDRWTGKLLEQENGEPLSPPSTYGSETRVGAAICRPAAQRARQKNMSRRPESKKKRGNASDMPKCGLCGKTDKLTKTECCGNWICDDEDQYVLFSYARNSCYRNHRRYTLCGYHHAEGHDGDWKTCQECRESFETEMYVYCGTNEYNFEKLENPPDYEPTKCSKCGSIIRLAEDVYIMTSSGYLCEKCSDFDWSQF